MALVEHALRPVFEVERLVLAGSRGGCAGVDRIFTAIERCILISEATGVKVALYGSPVHYRLYLSRLNDLGVKVYDNIDEIPQDSMVVTRAHGITAQEKAALKARGFANLIDGTCPLVDRVHEYDIEMIEAGRVVLHFCHKDHPEAKGVLGYNKMGYPGKIVPVETIEEAYEAVKFLPDETMLATSSQTTLNADDAKTFHKEIKRKFGDRVIVPDPKKDLICYATKWRQDALKAVLNAKVQAVIVVGSKGMSSNAGSLAKIAEKAGVKLLFIEGAGDLKEDDFTGAKGVGLTSAASVSQPFEQEVINWFRARGVKPETDEPGRMKAEARMTFKLPDEVSDEVLASLGLVYDSKRESLRQKARAGV